MTKQKQPPKRVTHCPLKQPTQYSPETACCEQKCALWVYMFTTENIPANGMCSIAAIALKNKEGKIVV